ncbi:hypothetical protein NUSPORA_01212 [Nucleospora cyclopteri]
MLLKTFLHFLKNEDTHNLFINEQNPEFMRMINNLRNPEDMQEIEAAFKFLFERTINSTDKNTIFHQESIKLLKKVDEFFNSLKEGRVQLNNAELKEKKSETDNYTKTQQEEQINPSNQQILPTQRNIYTNQNNLPAYDKFNYRGNFLLSEEEARNCRKKDFNEELAEIYLDSLKNFAVDIEDETLHKHIHYLETDGAWGGEQ